MGRGIHSPSLTVQPNPRPPQWEIKLKINRILFSNNHVSLIRIDLELFELGPSAKQVLLCSMERRKLVIVNTTYLKNLEDLDLGAL